MEPEIKKKKAIIIGGGLAGLTLATEMVDSNFDVIVLEKNKYLGGRASKIMTQCMESAVESGYKRFEFIKNDVDTL